MTIQKEIRSLTAAITAVAIATAAPMAALAGEARRTPDDQRTLISADVGDERWAITWNDSEDGTITGNVFFSDGREPAFLWCEDVTAEDEVDTVSFACFGAEACLASPCLLSQWSHVQDVTVPVAFFEAPNLEWLPVGETVTLPLSFLSPPQEGDDGSRGSGVQITVDDERVLINKDVGRERWAITRNTGDGSLTGNIYTVADGEAGFIWCEEVDYDEDAGEASYDCEIPGTNPPPSPTPTPKPTPTPTPTATPTPVPFTKATYEGPYGCDKYKDDYPTVFAHAVPFTHAFGTCWVCPAGFDRSVFSIEGDSACLKGGFIGIGAQYKPATHVGEWGCGRNAFQNGLKDECWSCPEGYSRFDAVNIDDPGACMWDGD